MNKELFIEKYNIFNMTESDIEKALSTIVRFEEYIDKTIEETSINDIKKYSSYLIDQKDNIYSNYIHIARYYYYIDYKDHYIQMTKYFNSFGVFESILERVKIYDSEETKNDIIENLALPPFGTDSKDLPEYAQKLMESLNKHLDSKSCHKILAGNNHGIPKSSQAKEKEFYHNSSSFEDYLRQRHERKVQELQNHLDENKVWFEQVITPEAVEYVASNQEILSGKIEGDKLYVTKIPFNINAFLSETDDTLKRYYACHCTFVRENIKNEKYDIPKEWCYCSAGFAKFPFEEILDQELDVTLLETPLDGDYVCRFEIDLSNVKYKK